MSIAMQVRNLVRGNLAGFKEIYTHPISNQPYCKATTDLTVCAYVVSY